MHGGVVAGRVRLNLGGNRSTMSSASRHDSSRRCDKNVLVTKGISGSSEMILEEQSSIAVASMKTTPKPLEVTICKTHWFRICLISSG